MFRQIVQRCARSSNRLSIRSKVNFNEFLGSIKVEDLSHIEKRDQQLRAQCDHLPNLAADEVVEARKKRIIYRSKQRGFLEADLLLGSWAKENVPGMTLSQLDEMEILLKEETLPLFNYICGREPLPDHLINISFMPKLLHYADSSSIFTPETYANLKRKANLT